MKLEHFKHYIGTGVKVYFENKFPHIHTLTLENFEDAFNHGQLILKKFPEHTEMLDITITEKYVQSHYDIFGYLSTGEALDHELFNYRKMIENANFELGRGDKKKAVAFFREAINLTDDVAQKSILANKVSGLINKIN